VVGNDNTVRYRGLSLQIPPSPIRPHFVKARVRVHDYPDGTLAIFHGPRRLARYQADGRPLDHDQVPGRLTPLGGPAPWTYGQRSALPTNPTHPTTTTAVNPCVTNTGQLTCYRQRGRQTGGHASIILLLTLIYEQRRCGYHGTSVSGGRMPIAATPTRVRSGTFVLAVLGCAVLLGTGVSVAPAGEPSDQAVAGPADREVPDRPDVDEKQLEDLVADAQRLLRLSGYDPGPIDGRLGLRTQRAIRAYQATARRLGTLEALKGPPPGAAAPGPELVGAELPAAKLDN
jgi:hypothetical protein